MIKAWRDTGGLLTLPGLHLKIRASGRLDFRYRPLRQGLAHDSGVNPE
jgi:hypothetical protein